MQSFFDSDDDYFWPIWIEELYEDAGQEMPKDLTKEKYEWRFVEEDDCNDLGKIDKWQDWYNVINET